MSLRKKHSDGKTYEVFPLELTRVQLGAERVYDRDTRGRSWFILDLVIPASKFIPLGSSGLITSDGETFYAGGRRT